MSTIQERYQITDVCCGLVTTRPSRIEAIDAARAHWRQHLDDSIPFVAVFVYDRMARIGAVQTWEVTRHGNASPGTRRDGPRGCCGEYETGSGMHSPECEYDAGGT